MASSKRLSVGTDYRVARNKQGRSCGFGGPGPSKNSHRLLLDHCILLPQSWTSDHCIQSLPKIESQRTHVSRQTLDKLIVMYTCTRIFRILYCL
jgi:hypothetical protein